MMIINEISPDGSDRIFQRTIFNQKASVLIKPSQNQNGIRESNSFFYLAKHLHEKTIPVPDIYEFKKDTGEIFVEDFGDKKFFDEIISLKTKDKQSEIFDWYEQAVKILAKMQVKGAEAFDVNWCYDTPFYDENIAFNRECLYFINSFLADYIGLSIGSFTELKEELLFFSKKVRNFKADFFLHRDFQSRNLMIFNGSIRIIDFQGGRLGPLGYDISSLLIDPYIKIEKALWKDLIKIYLDELTLYGTKRDFKEFWKEFITLGILRNMQILGAFSFLTQRKQKMFFKDFIAPALDNLKYMLFLHDNRELKNLIKIACDI